MRRPGTASGVPFQDLVDQRVYRRLHGRHVVPATSCLAAPVGYLDDEGFPTNDGILTARARRPGPLGRLLSGGSSLDTVAEMTRSGSDVPGARTIDMTTGNEMESGCVIL